MPSALGGAMPILFARYKNTVVLFAFWNHYIFCRLTATWRMYKLYGKAPNENWTYLFFFLTYLYMYIKHCRLKSKVIFPKIDVLVSALNAVQFFFILRKKTSFWIKSKQQAHIFPEIYCILYGVKNITSYTRLLQNGGQNPILLLLI